MAAKKNRKASVQPHEVVHPQEQDTQPKFKYMSVASRNEEQKVLIQAIHKNDLIITLGCPGSGKTFLACGLAAEYLQRGLVDKIILVRPSVGPESLGYLPGDYENKLMPYVNVMLIELGKFLDVKREMSRGTIEILPLAYMRGRTLDNVFVILDEGQNCTTHQLKMFFTRMGENSKFIVTADANQSDLDYKNSKDFPNFVKKLSKICNEDNKIAICTLTKSVRHRLVEIVLKIFEDPA